METVTDKLVSERQGRRRLSEEDQAEETTFVVPRDGGDLYLLGAPIVL
jgi:hypothetical protein